MVLDAKTYNLCRRLHNALILFLEDVVSGRIFVEVTIFDLIFVATRALLPEVSDCLILLSRFGLQEALLQTSFHANSDVVDQKHTAQNGKAHDADINDHDCGEVILVDRYLVNRMNVDCQLDLRLTVVVYAVEVAEEDIAEDEELCVTDHVRRLDHSKDAPASKFGVNMPGVDQVSSWLHFEHSGAYLKND